MIRLVAILLLTTTLSGCATMRRHPTATKVAIISIGLAGGVVAGLATRGIDCSYPPHDGEPGYSGRSPGCPKREPGEK